MIKKATFIIIIFSVLVPSVQAVEIERNKMWYINRWCQSDGGQMMVSLPDGSICECVTETHAYSMEFADQWEKAIESALHFSEQTGKKAGIMLIIEKKKNRKKWYYLKEKVETEKLPIDLRDIKAYNKQDTDKAEPKILRK